MNTAYIMLGSNKGDSHQALADARRYLQCYVGKVLRSSSIYETAPWGTSDSQKSYLNQALMLATYRSPGQLINTCLAIEKIMGRQRSTPNAARTMDIDIMFIDDMVVDQANLIVPHPRLHLRNFCLSPLTEIAPEFVHPVLGLTLRSLLEKLDDDLAVKRLD